MTDETARLLADLARAKAVFQHRAVVALLTEKPLVNESGRNGGFALGQTANCRGNPTLRCAAFQITSK